MVKFAIAIMDCLQWAAGLWQGDGAVISIISAISPIHPFESGDHEPFVIWLRSMAAPTGWQGASAL